MRYARSRFARAAAECLEPRRLLSLDLNGTAGDDNILVSVGTDDRIQFNLNGSIQVFDAPGDGFVSVLGRSGNDQISLQNTNLLRFYLTGHDGDDSFVVGNGVLERDIQEDVQVVEVEGPGNGGNDQLLINDALSDTSGTGLLVEDDSVLVLSSIRQPKIIYAMTSQDVINVQASSNDDVLYIESLRSNIHIDMGAGDDYVDLGGASHSVPVSIPTGVSIDGGPSGDDLLVMDDSNPSSARANLHIGDNTVLDLISVQGWNRMEIRTHVLPGSNPEPVVFDGETCPAPFVTILGAAGPDLIQIGSPAAGVSGPNYVDHIFMNLFSGSDAVELNERPLTSGQSGHSWFIEDTGIRSTTGSTSISTLDTISFSYRGTQFGDTLNVVDVPNLWTVNFNGSAGDDLVRQTGAPDIDDVFDGPSRLSFQGSDGVDSLEISDAADQTGDNDGYTLTDTYLTKGDVGAAQQEYVRYSTIENIKFVADADPNVVRYVNLGNLDSADIDGAGGNDTFMNVFEGSAGTNLMNGLAPSVILRGGAGINDLFIDDHFGGATGFYYLTASNFTYTGPTGTKVLQYSAFSSLAITCSDVGDFISIDSKPLSMTVNVAAAGGNDNVFVGGGDIDSNGFTVATTTISGGAGTEWITFEDRLDNKGATYTMDFFTLTKGASGVTYSSFESQTLETADVPTQPLIAANTVNINAVSSFFASTTIDGGVNRSSTVNVGNGNLNNVSGTLAVNLNHLPFDALNVSDQNDTGNDSYTLTATQLVKSSGASTQTISFSDASQFVLNANADPNLIAVNSTPAGTPTVINAGGGSDSITLGNGNIAANLLSPVTVNGGASSALAETVEFNNVQDTSPSTQTLNGLSFTDGQTHSVSSIDSILIQNGTGGGTLNMDRVSVFTNADSSSSNQTVSVGGGSLDANLLANCVVNRATLLTIDDRLDTGTDGYVQDDSGFRKLAAGSHVIGHGQNIGTIELQCSDANNSIQVNAGRSNMRFFGNGGNDNFLIADTQFFFNLETVGIDTGPENPGGDPRLGDFVTVNSDFGTPGDVGAMAKLLNDDVIRTLTIYPSGTFIIPSGVTADIRELIIPGGTIDVDGGSLLSIPGGPTQAFLATLLARGYNNGNWNGTHPQGAINSSMAAGGAPTDTLGYAFGSQVADSTSGEFTIDDSDTVVRYTFYGDTDLNQTVDFDDYVRTDAGFNGAGGGWSNGDFDFNNVVDFDDYVLLDLGFNGQ